MLTFLNLKNLEEELYVHFLLIGSKTPQTYEYN